MSRQNSHGGLRVCIWCEVYQYATLQHALQHAQQHTATHCNALHQQMRHDLQKRSTYAKRDLRNRPTKETYKKDLARQKRLTKETYKKEQQKRPTKETHKSDPQTRPTDRSTRQTNSVTGHSRSKITRNLYMPKESHNETYKCQKRPIYAKRDNRDLRKRPTKETCISEKRHTKDIPGDRVPQCDRP